VASSKRVYTNNNGKMFIPMNVEGGSWNENFITTPKLVVLGVSLFTFITLVIWLKSIYASITAYIIFIGMYFLIVQYILRYIVFEEKMYYNVYKQLKKYKITTPELFWKISHIKELNNGAILTYVDGKVGVLIKLERDTITGKSVDFKEVHYDAISDFYKELVTRRYNFIQMNLMEQAGNDPRLVELDKLNNNTTNANLNKLMEKQIGYIKSITHRTLYESDYFLIYTNDLNKKDRILEDVLDSLSRILEGCFIGFKILNIKDILEIIREVYGVKYFNYTEAMLSIYNDRVDASKKPFKISEIVYSDGTKQKLTEVESKILNKISNDLLNGTLDINKVSIKDKIKETK